MIMHIGLTLDAHLAPQINGTLKPKFKHEKILINDGHRCADDIILGV